MTAVMVRLRLAGLCMCAIVACGGDNDSGAEHSAGASDDGSGGPGPGTTTDPTTGDAATSNETGVEPPTMMRACELYLDCLSVVSPGQLPMQQEGFGPDGTCWQGSPETAEQCITACQTALAGLHESYLEEPKCGLCQENPDCPADSLCAAGE